MRCPKCKTINKSGSIGTCRGCGRQLLSEDALMKLDRKGKPIGSAILFFITGAYLSNATGGVDILPDLVPFVGNLDEVGATVAFIKSGFKLGLDPFGLVKAMANNLKKSIGAAQIEEENHAFE